MSIEAVNGPREEQHLLQDEFSLYPGKETAVLVTLHGDRIVLAKPRRAAIINGANGRAARPHHTLRLVDVVGCECGRGRTSPSISKLSLTALTGKKSDGVAAFLCLHSYPYNKPVASGGWRRKQDVKIRVNKFDTYEQNLEIAQKWRLAILLILRGVSVTNEEDIKTSRLPAARKLLVLVNPASGRRKGLQIFNKQVRPIFRDAELDYELVVTVKQFQAREMASTLDPKEWQGIVVVAGDGLVYEVLNGMMMHENPSSVLKVPIGIIPAGSGNALFAAVIAKAGRIHSFLAITWGIIADIDIESERFRWMGKPRFTIGTVIRILNLRRYRGCLSYLPVENQEIYEHLKRPAVKPVSKKKQKHLPRPHSTIDTSIEGLGDPQPQLRRFQSLNADLSTISAANGLAFSDEFIKENGEVDRDVENRCTGETPPLQSNGSASVPCNSAVDPSAEASPSSTFLPPSLADPLPADWTTIEGDFVGILITYLSHIGEDVSVWPGRKFDEGVISIQYIRFPTSRRNMAEFVDAIQTGRHLTLPFTKSVFVKAFRMVPLTEPGIITVDGEVIEYGPVQGEVLSHKPNIIFPANVAAAAK